MTNNTSRNDSARLFSKLALVGGSKMKMNAAEISDAMNAAKLSHEIDWGNAKLALHGRTKMNAAEIIDAVNAADNVVWLHKAAVTTTMTFFPDQFAKTMKVKTLTLQELADRIIAKTARKKENLPFVKFATFSGEVNPDNPNAGCLRCDANVVEITGVEGDKDDAPLSLDEAVEKLKAAGLRALLYTSASHTDEKPRFRVLCPTSCAMPPEERKKLIARLNGVLGGALSPELFALSQSYYFGAVKGNPAPLVRIIDGDCIDMRPDLDAGALGKGGKKKDADDYDSVWAEFAAQQSKKPMDVDQALAEMVEGGSDGTKEDCIYRTQLRVSAALLNRGMSAEDIVEKLLSRTMEVARDPSEQTRKEQLKQLQHMIASWLRKHPELKETAFPEVGDTADKPEKLQFNDKNQNRIYEALRHIPKGHRVDDIGKALHSLNWMWDYFDHGLEAWDWWAKWDDAYQGFKDLQARWGAFDRKNGTINTLFEIAREHGWEDAETTKAKLLQSTAEFLEDYMPPDYLVDGLLQRRYVYSLTAPTGSGKTAIALRIAIHVAFGLPLAGRDVEKGRVLFFAGENPDDVRSRWIMLCEKMGYEWQDVEVFFMPFTLDLEKFRKQIDAETEEHGPFSLLIVDTSAAYYSGNDENDNVALGNHARMLRTFVDLPGGPTVLVTCHPTKNPNPENLLPRGGGAFLAEVDGNLVCLKEFGSMVVEVTTHGKFRGPDFKPFAFKLVPGQSDKLVDTKGRHVWTITAEPISDTEQEEIKKAGNRHQDDLLRLMLQEPGLSIREMAEKLDWFTVNDEPNKNHVNRMLKDLKKAKLVEQGRNDQYELTAKGEKEAQELPPKHFVQITPIDAPKSRSQSKERFEQRYGRVKVIESCPEDAVCLHCRKSGNVMRVCDARRPGSKSETLHEECAVAWFDKREGEETTHTR